MPRRVVFVCSHPIQYLAPWFAYLAQRSPLHIEVLYATLTGQTHAMHDRDFARPLTWDVDLLSGYSYSVLKNHAPRPGLDRFFGVLSLQIGEKLRALRPDALVVLGWNYALYPIALAFGRLAGVPVLMRGDSVRYADAEAEEPKLPPWVAAKRALSRRLLSRYLSACSGALAVSTGNRRLLLYLGVPPERIFFAPYAVDERRFRLPNDELSALRLSTRQALGIGADTTVFLFCGKLCAVKNPGLLLAAFAALRGNTHALWFCGTGPLGAELAQAAASTPAVSFLGFRNQSELPALYAAADVLVVPSVREAFAMVVPEAMHAGRPVIASDRVGCHEDLIEPGQTGLVFRQGDKADLLRCLKGMSEGDQAPALRQQMGQHAREKMASWTYAQTTEGLLRALGV